MAVAQHVGDFYVHAVQPDALKITGVYPAAVSGAGGDAGGALFCGDGESGDPRGAEVELERVRGESVIPADAFSFGSSAGIPRDVAAVDELAGAGGGRGGRGDFRADKKLEHLPARGGCGGRRDLFNAGCGTGGVVV